AFSWFLVGRFIRYFGAFPVSLERVGIAKALKKAREVLRNGDTLVVFPEGSREFSDGRLLPFKTGAAKIAVDAGVPILPVTIRGANRVWSQDHRLPRPGKVEIFYHPILETTGKSRSKSGKAYLEELTAELERVIASEMSDTDRA
ncbi:MAG: 1-acyl-sn-glycerol-3-phosphate acyltransferase, partial [Pyrinomonadaceae bacterium]|nr:1-acyl-sn-glycerol-3-phosphate acyltransferase [Pyrinomonadaceae bacterium]